MGEECEGESSCEEALEPARGREPGEESRERNKHEQTHLPYRSWCRFCVMGRGRLSGEPQAKGPRLACGLQASGMRHCGAA